MNAKFSTPPPELGTRDEDDPVELEVATPPPFSTLGLRIVDERGETDPVVRRPGSGAGEVWSRKPMLTVRLCRPENACSGRSRNSKT